MRVDVLAESLRLASNQRNTLIVLLVHFLAQAGVGLPPDLRLGSPQWVVS